MKFIGFFNNKGGVGKTSLVYHLSWIYSDLGYKVISADLDAQANLTNMFVDEERLEALWSDSNTDGTIFSAIRPLLEGTGDVVSAFVEDIADNLGLVVGDLRLSGSEDELNSRWPECLDRKAVAFRVLSAFYRSILGAAIERQADVVLVDMGPNLGALNRAALIGCDYVIVPLAADLYSLQGLRNLGPTLRRWRAEWADRLQRNSLEGVPMPGGRMEPAGYVVMQHGVRLDRPVKAYEKWISRIPPTYRSAVLDENASAAPSVTDDPHCLALLKHYHSLMPLAMEARKPMFHLRPADGAIGAHMAAVTSCYGDFRALALKIAERCALPRDTLFD